MLSSRTGRESLLPLFLVRGTSDSVLKLEGQKTLCVSAKAESFKRSDVIEVCMASATALLTGFVMLLPRKDQWQRYNSGHFMDQTKVPWHAFDHVENIQYRFRACSQYAQLHSPIYRFSRCLFGSTVCLVPVPEARVVVAKCLSFLRRQSLDAVIVRACVPFGVVSFHPDQEPGCKEEDCGSCCSIKAVQNVILWGVFRPVEMIGRRCKDKI